MLKPAGETIIVTAWVTAPDIDYWLPPILSIGGRGAVCTWCHGSVEGERLVEGQFCSEGCRDLWREEDKHRERF